MWEDSASAGATLHGMLGAKNAQTILLLTWGRRDGDSTNSWLYPDFSTMQDQLTEGYLAYQARFGTPEQPAWIAPAGLAYAAVHDAEADPLASEALFFRLYVEDGSHPSQLGTWLIASTLYSTITGKSAEGLSPPFAIDQVEADYLALTAYQVVTTGVGGLSYPWESPVDSGGTDSGSDSPADSQPDSAEDVDSPGNDSVGQNNEEPDEKAEGCGCQQAGGMPSLLLLGLVSLVGRRGK